MDPETSQALATRISRILQSVIEISDKSLPRLAARQLDSVYADYATRSQPVTFLQFIQHIWDAFMRVAGQLDRNGDGHRKLARIIRWLEKLPNRPFPDDYDESDEILYGFVYHSHIRFANARSAISIAVLTPPGLSSTDAEFQRCLNVHTFTALLTKSYLIPLPRQAILAIGQATEGATVQKEDGGPEFVSNDPLDIEQLDMKVAVAAIWVQHAGHVLWRHNPRYTIGEGGPLWKEFYERLSKEDPNYLSLYRERWGVWVLQFGEISENSDVAEETRDIAGEVSETLDEIYSMLESDNPKAPSLDIDLLYVNMLHQAQEEHSSTFTRVMEEYLSYYQSWLPVVMERPFRKSLERLGHQPRAETALLALAILLVVQGGLPDRATNPSHRSYILCKELYALLQLRRAPSLQLVQSGLLIALYETGISSSGAASLTIASCARLGYSMKLNIDNGNAYEDYLSWEAAEERRRVWTGIYLLDRVIYQVVTEFKAPHVSEDLADHFRLPVDDACLRTDKSEATQAPSHQPMSVPIDVPLCYYAREIQAVRLLGEVQLLQRHVDVNSLPEKFQSLDHRLMQFAERLFEQTPQGWATLCGANAITLT
ncbi:unnamed protein product [Aspergillus oryzae]|uniref:Unnamed protein product n=1 Tax=Aspergillus oryzae TaxID=5062 RepID=A0AAN4YW67_ASPOZ|nr:unnamed protein product [Aspergillus oryzae]GMF89521.1 unnamed protein product [Aspergillus oryzae]GMG36593.1 unnamed protein product [Aspergillus oryzae]